MRGDCCVRFWGVIIPVLHLKELQLDFAAMIYLDSFISSILCSDMGVSRDCSNSSTGQQHAFFDGRTYNVTLEFLDMV